MNIKNLPELIRLNKNRKCYVCGKTIRKGENAVYHWWITPKEKAYDHVGCRIKK